MRLAPVGRSCAEVGLADGEVVEVDDVEVGPHPCGDHAPVGEAVHRRGCAGELVDRELERHPLALGAVADPVGEVERGRRAVGDQR